MSENMLATGLPHTLWIFGYWHFVLLPVAKKMFCLLFATPVCLTLRSSYSGVLFLAIQSTRLNYRDSTQSMKHIISALREKKHREVFYVSSCRARILRANWTWFTENYRSVESLHKTCVSNHILQLVESKSSLKLFSGIWLVDLLLKVPKNNI